MFWFCPEQEVSSMFPHERRNIAPCLATNSEFSINDNKILINDLLFKQYRYRVY